MPDRIPSGSACDNSRQTISAELSNLRSQTRARDRISCVNGVDVPVPLCGASEQPAADSPHSTIDSLPVAGCRYGVPIADAHYYLGVVSRMRAIWRMR